MSVLDICLSNEPNSFDVIEKYLRNRLYEKSPDSIDLIKNENGYIIRALGGNIEHKRIKNIFSYLENLKNHEFYIFVQDSSIPNGKYYHNPFGDIEEFDTFEKLETRKAERNEWFSFNFGKSGNENTLIIRMLFKTKKAAKSISDTFKIAEIKNKNKNWPIDFIDSYNKTLAKGAEASWMSWKREGNNEVGPSEIIEHLVFIKSHGCYCYIGFNLDGANILNPKEFMHEIEYSPTDVMLISLSFLNNLKRTWIKWRFEELTRNISEVNGVYPYSDVPQYSENKDISPDWQWTNV